MRVYRPEKLNNQQTVLYEIDMLRYAANRLRVGFRDDVDRWVYLEGFLLHFRNLAEFFSGKEPRDGDISVRTPKLIWEREPSAEQLRKLTHPELWDKYEPRGDEKARISQYLQHCTEKRLESKDWDIGEMFNDLDPVLQEFERLATTDRPWESALKDQAKPIAFLDSFSASTASVSRAESFTKPMTITMPPKKD